MISGPFDADKLDYMARDAMMCGLPTVTDIPRLIQKIRCVRIGQDRLPEEIARNISSKHSYVVTGIARSGARTLDELSLARTLMFDKVYRHQKVRAAEAMVAALINRLVDIASIESYFLPYQISDEELFSLTEDSIRAIFRLPEDLSAEDMSNVEIAADLARRLRQRELLARGFAFSDNMPTDPHSHDLNKPAGMNLLTRHINQPSSRLRLVERIAALAPLIHGA